MLKIILGLIVWFIIGIIVIAICIKKGIDHDDKIIKELKDIGYFYDKEDDEYIVSREIILSTYSYVDRDSYDYIDFEISKIIKDMGITLVLILTIILWPMAITYTKKRRKVLEAFYEQKKNESK